MKNSRQTILVLCLGAALWWYLSGQTEYGGSGADSPDGDGGGFDPYADTIGAVGALMSSQSVSANGVALIAAHEGCRLAAYGDAGTPSIGYGHKPASQGQTIDQSTADSLLQSDAAASCKTVLKYITVGLNQNQLDALTDFVYNVGSGHFASSTLRSVLNAGNYDQVPAQLARWVYSQGQYSGALAQRRQDCIALWNTPVQDASSDDTATNDGYSPDDVTVMDAFA